VGADKRRPRRALRTTGVATTKRRTSAGGPHQPTAGKGNRCHKAIYACPVCGKAGKLTVTAKSAGGWLIGCWACQAAGLSGGEYIRALADAVGAPGGGAVLENPFRYLGEPVTASHERRLPAELPSSAALAGWTARLPSSGPPLDYLLNERGLELDTIRLHQVGWDGEAFTLPVFDSAGDPVNVRRRFWPERKPKITGLAGRPATFYPSHALAGPGPLLLVAGEFDALLSQQNDIPGVSTTCGARLPEPLIPELQPDGRRIAVAYDVGEEAAAERTVAQLRTAGAKAWVVRLGLPNEGDDLTDWFVKYGRSADKLLALIRREGGRV
jgi:hypothetical protein